jgi:type I restriction enzyme M protein
VDDPAAYHAEGVLYLTPNARYDQLLALPEATDIGKAINDAIRDIEKDNPQLAGVLPKTYNLFTSTLLKDRSHERTHAAALAREATSTLEGCRIANGSG